MRRNGMCPVCYMRRKLLGAKIQKINIEKLYENGVGRTPLMGWSSWNAFANKIDENLILETAVAMKEKGLSDVGYTYVNIDDCWMSSLRDANGDWQSDLTAFSKGIPELVKKINALGLKVGLYSSNGTMTCEDLPASLGREETDAMTLARWGVEYFKYDFCNNVPYPPYAPLVYGISIAPFGEHVEKQYLCSNAILGGMAKRMKNAKLPGGYYLSGLDGGIGTARFDNVFAEHGGKYVLTLEIMKFGRYEKYVVVNVNNQEYSVSVPSLNPYSVTTRYQIIVDLKQGVNTVTLYNPISCRRESAVRQYRKMSQSLKDAAEKVALHNNAPIKPILFSICEWGVNKPWKWGATVGNMWRTTGDIKENWARIMQIYERNVVLHEYASAGHFNDPDMLEVGNGNLNYHENLSHFALWCFMAAPLVLGNDVRQMDKQVLEIITNTKLIAIDQDELCKQAVRLIKGKVDVLAKPLINNQTALLCFNKTKKERKYSVKLNEILADSRLEHSPLNSYSIESIIGEYDYSNGVLSAVIPPHGSSAFIIK